jgi:hypothetical protein
MNKIAVAILSTVLILIVIGVFFAVQTPWTQNPEEFAAEIEDFQWMASRWNTTGGAEAQLPFNFTVHNASPKEISNLTVQIKVYDVDGSQVKTNTFFDGSNGTFKCENGVCPIEHLLKDENRTFTGAVSSDAEALSRAAYPLTANITLKTGNGILDEFEVKVTSFTIEIEEFHWTSHWYIVGGAVQAGRAFNLTVHNLSSKEIGNLTVQIKIFDANNSQVEIRTFFYGPNGGFLYENNICPIGRLLADESHTFSGAIESDGDNILQSRVAYPLTAHVSLKMDDTVLDELEVEALS